MITKDIRYAIRLLAKNPGFTLLTTLVMAAGIGLSVYMFSMLNIIYFKDLPFEDGGSLVSLYTSQNGNRIGGQFDPLDFQEVRTHLKGLSEISVHDPVSVNVSGRDGARRYKGSAVEADFFHITRTKPILGREFTNAESQTGADPVAVIGYDIWQNQYNGDPAVLGQTMRIDGIVHRIIGVMPQGYFFPSDSELWLPLQQDAMRLPRTERRNVRVVAHIENGYSIEDINRQLTLIMQRIAEKDPKANSGIGAYVEKFQGTGDGIFIYSMQLSAVLILLLASLNVGNLLFSRSIERVKETAIRAALGAPRSRLVGQMLWESIIICGVGGIIGLSVVAWGLEITEVIFATFTSDRPPFWWEFGIDAFTIKLFSVFVVGTILVTGVWPAWRNTAGDFNSVLRDGTRGALGKRAGRLSRLLVVSEIFISITVLITAGMLIVTSYKVTHAENGANTENLLVAKIIMPKADYNSADKQAQFAKTLQSRLENTAGIGNVMLATAIPGDFVGAPEIALDGKEYTQKGGYPRANYVALMPGSLAKLGVELKEGRYFSSGDGGLDKKTIIVTDSFANRHFPNESALGKRIRIIERDSDEVIWLTIVGVVEHAIFGRPLTEQSNRGALFRPFTQAPGPELHVVMQMKANRSAVIKTLRSKLASIDPALPAFRFETYTERLNRYYGGLRFVSNLFLIFGIATVLLAASGIYGVMSNTINQRTQEIGVKRALGAVEQRISKEFLAIGLKQLLWGGIPGFLIGCGLGFSLSNATGVDITDLLIISLPLIAVIGVVVVFSTWLPTQRALQIDPSEALRHE